MRVKLGFIAAAAAACVAAVAPVDAYAEERTCRGALGAATVDNLRVPQGAKCVLRGTRVKGTIKVERGATLHASRIRVVGNVQAEGARHVQVTLSRIGGGVQVVQGRSSRIVRNAVNADVQYFENRGAIVVTRNRIGGNLQCKENNRRPTGGRNVVDGTKEDQCAHL